MYPSILGLGEGKNNWFRLCFATHRGKLVGPARRLLPLRLRCLEQYPRRWDSLVQPSLEQSRRHCLPLNFLRIPLGLDTTSPFLYLWGVAAWDLECFVYKSIRNTTTLHKADKKCKRLEHPIMEQNIKLPTGKKVNDRWKKHNVCRTSATSNTLEMVRLTLI